MDIKAVDMARNEIIITELHAGPKAVIPIRRTVEVIRKDEEAPSFQRGELEGLIINVEISGQFKGNLSDYLDEHGAINRDRLMGDIFTGKLPLIV